MTKVNYKHPARSSSPVVLRKGDEISLSTLKVTRSK